MITLTAATVAVIVNGGLCFIIGAVTGFFICKKRAQLKIEKDKILGG